MSESYLITGGTGFVGSALVRRLVHDRKKVSLIVRNKKLSWRLDDVKNKVEVFTSNLNDNSLKNIIEKVRPTHIFHLAAYGVDPLQDDIDQVIQNNIHGTINLLREVQKVKFSLFIHAGSSSEYGVKEEKIKEDSLLEPINHYGVSKAAVTLFCQEIAKQKNLPIITLRIFSPYGPYQQKERVIPWIISNALQNNPIPLTSKKNVRDFIYIEDVVNAFICASKKKYRPGEIINIGSGVQHSLSDIIKIVLTLTKSTSKPQWAAVSQQQRQIEPKIWQSDISKAVDLLDWKPEYTLNRGLENTIIWMKEFMHYYE